MPLNTAQYVAPLNSQGVLTGYVQGVKQGPGVSILPDGTITLDASTAVGFVITNNPNAAQYTWPTAGAAEAGQLLANSGTGGLYWSSDFVRTVPSGGSFAQTGAAAIPAGSSGQRPGSPDPGYLRYNSQTGAMEYWGSSGWTSLIDSGAAATTPEAIAGLINTKYSSPATAIAKSSPGTTGAAVLPAGTTGQRPGAAAGVSAGWTRFNFDFQRLEYYDGANWVLINPYLQQLDDISGLFDGVIDTFELRIAGIPYYPNPVDNLLVFLGGVQQIPGPAWTIVFGRYIKFASPPAATTTCYIGTVTLG
jgi:hypothetical protein